MKSVLISIQPYWVFLIIAKIMGWKIKEEKTIEIRKNYPKDSIWNRKTVIYCSKDKKSFNRIPKEYQPFMTKFLGKVIGEFICDEIIVDEKGENQDIICENGCLTRQELLAYEPRKIVYGWHIPNLKIYDKPKELSEFKVCLEKPLHEDCNDCIFNFTSNDCVGCGKYKIITRPPQSWCYVEEL